MYLYQLHESFRFTKTETQQNEMKQTKQNEFASLNLNASPKK